MNGHFFIIFIFVIVESFCNLFRSFESPLTTNEPILNHFMFYEIGMGYNYKYSSGKLEDTWWNYLVRRIFGVFCNDNVHTDSIFQPLYQEILFRQRKVYTKNDEVKYLEKIAQNNKSDYLIKFFTEHSWVKA